ncbi:hypothetical protein LXM94_23345 [Rhizobium sp. TRM95111]|uniref:hypothetical protein n=1 Tax=Rhizobium alarense TaxID=2846851 RepID=UPI001F170D1E|nr:hypothetical protein [Rhizobium alarense]MCF3642905.1 hypothetical protein [Rhizobium alarense]
MTRETPFKQVDVKRALKGAEQAGFVVGRIEIDPSGKITVIARQEAAEPATALDEWRAKRARATEGH